MPTYTPGRNPVHLHLFLAVFRETEDGPWMPIGAIKNVIGYSATVREALIGQLDEWYGKDVTFKYTTPPPDLAENQALYRVWRKDQDDNRKKRWGKPFTNAKGWQFDILMCRLAGDFTLPHAPDVSQA